MGRSFPTRPFFCLHFELRDPFSVKVESIVKPLH
jgi:hypothetical protein